MKKGAISVLSLFVGAAAGATAGAVGVGRKAGDKIADRQKLADKHLALYLMMNQWVKVKQEGKNLSAYFENNSYKKIAVYGMNYVGETLLSELKGSGLEIAYAIDRKADTIYADVDVYTAEDALEKVDVVVVTAITFFDEIKEKLGKKMDCPIISLEDILYEV
ncbi:MAG: hypothetical protein HFI51_10055 [Lachnospiraceae bacterium]|nr:hypothetical protein [Lachnospiraceae bacterium]